MKKLLTAFILGLVFMSTTSTSNMLVDKSAIKDFPDHSNSIYASEKIHSLKASGININYATIYATDDPYYIWGLLSKENPEKYTGNPEKQNMFFYDDSNGKVSYDDSVKQRILAPFYFTKSIINQYYDKNELDINYDEKTKTFTFVGAMGFKKEANGSFTPIDKKTLTLKLGDDFMISSYQGKSEKLPIKTKAVIHPLDDKLYFPLDDVMENLGFKRDNQEYEIYYTDFDKREKAGMKVYKSEQEFKKIIGNDFSKVPDPYQRFLNNGSLRAYVDNDMPKKLGIELRHDEIKDRGYVDYIKFANVKTENFTQIYFIKDNKIVFTPYRESPNEFLYKNELYTSDGYKVFSDSRATTYEADIKDVDYILFSEMCNNVFILSENPFNPKSQNYDKKLAIPKFKEI